MLVDDPKRHIRSVQSDHVAAEPLDHRQFDLGQHLVQVEDSRGCVESQSLFQLMIGGSGDARLPRPADVDWHSIRDLMVDGPQHSLA